MKVLKMLAIICFYIISFCAGFYSLETLGAYIKTKNKEDIQKNKSGIFHMHYGGAICGYYEINNCGVTLKKCMDDKEYYCMQNVSVELDKSK